MLLREQPARQADGVAHAAAEAHVDRVQVARRDNVQGQEEIGEAPRLTALVGRGGQGADPRRQQIRLLPGGRFDDRELLQPGSPRLQRVTLVGCAAEQQAVFPRERPLDEALKAPPRELAPGVLGEPPAAALAERQRDLEALEDLI